MTLQSSCDIKKIISERLRLLRTNKGLNQYEAAQRVGLQPAALSHFENALRVPSFENLRKFADLYAVSVDYLLGRTEEPKAGGPAMDLLFRSIDGIDPDDLKALAEMARSLAERNRRRQ